jgi:hypothetical protein
VSEPLQVQGIICVKCPECGTKIPDPEKNLWRSYLRKLEIVLRKKPMGRLPVFGGERSDKIFVSIWDSVMGQLSFLDRSNKAMSRGPAAASDKTIPKPRNPGYER